MTAYSGIVVDDSDVRRRQPSQLKWLADGVQIASRLGTPDTTAIVNPFKFTTAIMKAARARGAEIRHGCVTGIVRNTHDMAACGVEVDGSVIEVDAVIVAMGPWSLMASEWTSMPAVYSRRSPSIVYDTGADVPAHALFLEYEEPGHGVVGIEVFPRADGSTHITAFSDMRALPLDPAAVKPDPGENGRLQAIAARLSPVFRADRIIAHQACFRPVTQDALPLIGKAPRSEGVYIATGHNVWGILNAPATGEALAELIMDGTARNVDLAPFDPSRLPVLDPAKLQTD